MPTLRTILEALGPAVRTLTGDQGLDAEVNEVLILGPGDPVPQTSGTLLVCLNATSVLASAAAAGAVGVVLKLADTEEAAAGAWAEAPIPVIAADNALPWHHLLQLLTTAVSSALGSVGGGGAVGDLFALANAIAAMVGGAVAIEDPQRRVLAYSSLPDQPIDEARRLGILGRQVPDYTRNDAIYRDVQRAPGVTRIAADGPVLPRLAVAVRSGPELLGSLWVVESAPLGAEAEKALLDAGRLAALHLLRARAGSDMERRNRGELLRGLLDGRSSPELAAARLGLDVAKPVVVLGFGLPESTASDDLDAESAADLVHLQCAAFRQHSCVVVQLGTVYVLIPLDADTPRARLTQLANAVIDRARAALHIELTGAVGATVAGLHEVTRSRTDVDAVLRLVPAGTVGSLEHVLPQVVLLALQSHLAGLPHLRLPALDRLLTHDAEQGTPYAESMLAYLAANADIPAAAESVSVHPNTFRYRLRRVKELFEIDLDDPDVRLVCWLQLRIRP